MVGLFILQFLKKKKKCLPPSWELTCPICWNVSKSSSYFLLDTLTYNSWRRNKNVYPWVLTRRTCWSVWTTLSWSRPCSRGAAWPVSGCWCSRSGWTSGWRCYCSLVEPLTEFLQMSATSEGCDGRRWNCVLGWSGLSCVRWPSAGQTFYWAT